jgi:hypothetical protein
MLTEHEAALRSLPPLPVGSLINERYRVEELLTQGDCNVYLASSKDDTFIVKEGAGDQNTFETEIAKLKRTAYPTVTTFVERVEQENQYYFICTAPRSMAPLYVIHFASWRENPFCELAGSCSRNSLSVPNPAETARCAYTAQRFFRCPMECG